MDCLRISAFKREWLLSLFHTKYPTLQSPYIHIYNLISEVWRFWFLKEKSLEQWFHGTGTSLCYYIFLSSSYDYPNRQRKGLLCYVVDLDYQEDIQLMPENVTREDHLWNPGRFSVMTLNIINFL